MIPRTSLSDFRKSKRMAGFEGGAIYSADEDGKFFLIINQTALFDLLSEDDQEGLRPIEVLEFSSSVERQQYAFARGWIRTRSQIMQEVKADCSADNQVGTSQEQL
ncbi:MAG TPA: hypothetical protein VGK03_10270 [Geothrix sp.]|jgi:hypothetical protein